MRKETFFKAVIHLVAIVFTAAVLSVWIVPLLSNERSPKVITGKELVDFLSTHRVGSSPDYAVVKNGDDYLMIVMGYADDYKTCLDLIKPYNDNQSLSVFPGTYQCVALNK